MKKLIFHLILLTGSTFTAFAQTKQLPIEEFKLKNGTEVRMIKFGSIPAASISCFINVGKKTETPGQQNLSSITANALLLGNEKYTRVDQDNTLATLGAAANVNSNDNFTEINLRFLNKDADQALDIFSNIILKPKFPADDIKELIEKAINYNNPPKMDIGQLGEIFSNYVLFGTAHPLGRNFYRAQLEKITAAKISEFYKFNYTPKNTKIVVAGNFDNAKMKATLEKLFENWNATYGENNGAAYDVAEINKKEYFFVDKAKAEQAFLCWNKKAPDANSKDALLFEMANSTFSTLLFKEIRVKEGKTYGIGSSFDKYSNNGFYNISTQVRNEVAYETTVSFDRVIKQFYESGITQAELDKTKAALKNNRLSIETPGSVIDFYNPMLYKDVNKRNEYLSLIDAVTLEQVNKIIKKYFNPNAYKLVIVGNTKALEPQMQKIPGLVKLPLTSIEKDN